MTELNTYVKTIENALNKSVTKTLEKKKKLGQYAVIWKNEKVVRILENKNNK